MDTGITTTTALRCLRRHHPASLNIVAVGTTDEDIYAVAKEIERSQGDIACAAKGQVVASLALPLAGLLSVDSLESVVAGIETLEEAALELGCTLPSPYSTLSFLALAVVPEIKHTDRGLVDVVAGDFVRAGG